MMTSGQDPRGHFPSADACGAALPAKPERPATTKTDLPPNAKPASPRRVAWASGLPLGFAALLVLGCSHPSSEQGPGPDSTIPDSAASPALRIEEICPSNTALIDERGEDPGWVEIANRADTAVSLGAWRLRGRAEDGPGWRLPDTTLAPGERLVVFMSGLDIRRSLPAGDTVEVFNPSNVWAWADGENDPPGNSSWKTNGFPRLAGKRPDGRIVVAAELVLVENPEPGLGWSSASFGMIFKGMSDVSGRDYLRLVATIPVGQPLLLRFCQEGQECWKGSYVPIRGTGKEFDVYDIPLQGCAADFAHLVGIQIDPPENIFGSYKFTVAGVAFHRGARRPHASFQLARKGATLLLEDTSGSARQAVEYPSVPPGSSWAFSVDDGKWSVRETPTPDGSNPPGPAAPVLPAPPFVTATGIHPSGPLRVQVAAVPGAEVRCALGGAEPTRSSPSAAAGILLDSSAVVRCAAFGPNGASSPVSSGTFLLGESVHLPVVSLVAEPGALFDPDTGIYSKGPMASTNFPYFGANFWRDVEIPAHVELFENGRRSFGIRAGIGIYGNWSRGNDKKSFSVQLREKYGPRHLEWPLFPEHPDVRRFKGFGLRNNGGNYGKEHFRDALMTSLTEGRGIEYQYSRHVVVYINGRYWGVYDLREKLDPDYVDSRFGIDPASIDLLKNFREVQAGTAVAWTRLAAELEGSDLSDTTRMASVASQLDVDNFADYVGAEVYFANTDWPANNVRSWRPAAPGGRWRMMLFDTDFGFGGEVSQLPADGMLAFATDTSKGPDDWPNGTSSTLAFRRLLGNPAWKARFINRLCVQLSTNFSAARAGRALDSVIAVVEPELARDLARWRLSLPRIRREYQAIRSFIDSRPSALRAEMRTFFPLGAEAAVVLRAPGGRVLLDGIDVGAEYRGTHFADHPLHLVAEAQPGRVFVRWSDGGVTAERTVAPAEAGLELTAEFR